jgi:hypothetical protein
MRTILQLVRTRGKTWSLANSYERDNLTAQGWMHDHDYEVECESPSQAVISDSGTGASKSGDTT